MIDIEQSQVRKAIEEIAQINDNDFGRRGWVNLSLLSEEIQGYMSQVMHVEMSIVEIENVIDECNYGQLINNLKLGR